MMAVVAAVIRRGGGIMLCQRRPGAHNPLKWEFPGGKIEPGESPEAALARELMEELDIRVEVGRIVDAVCHRYADRDVLVLFYDCRIAEGEPRTLDCNFAEMARRGVDLLRDRIHGDDRPPRTVTCPVRLVCRGSCRPKA